MTRGAAIGVRSGETRDVVSLHSRRGRRIVYLWPYLEWGGAQLYFSAMMKQLTARHDVVAVMPEGSDEKIRAYMERLGVRCEFFPAHMDLSLAKDPWQKVRRRLGDARCAFAIARHLRRNDLRNGILHADLGPWSWFPLLVYLSLRGNVFMTLHIAVPAVSFLRRLRLKLVFAVLSRVAGFHLLVSNMDMRESLKPYLRADYLRSVPLAYTGVDPAEISRALHEPPDRQAMLRRFGLPDDRLLVFSLGQLIERKGCFTLLEAAERLREADVSPCFVWIGDGNQRPAVERRIADDGLRDSFRILPPARIGHDRMTLLRLLSLADFFVHPSFSEGLPGAVLEAMALGKACIASRVNAIPEAVRDNETGILVPPGDAGALSDAILRLARDIALRDRLGAAAQAHVLANFDERIAARVTIDAYRTCFGDL